MGNTTLLILESWGYNWQISLYLVIITISTCTTRTLIQHSCVRINLISHTTQGLRPSTFMNPYYRISKTFPYSSHVQSSCSLITGTRTLRKPRFRIGSTGHFDQAEP
jgi:hypothetical protein